MTSTQFHCAICGAGLSVGAESAGRVIECPACRHVVPVPVRLPRGAIGTLPLLPPEVLALELKFLCPGCQAKLRIDARLEGESVACPKCQQPTRVPRWSAPPRETELRVAPKRAELSAAEIEFLSSPADANEPRIAAG
jgi:DNA-directed RNA polymerase subunit RPC12/RpoP